MGPQVGGQGGAPLRPYVPQAARLTTVAVTQAEARRAEERAALEKAAREEHGVEAVGFQHYGGCIFSPAANERGEDDSLVYRTTADPRAALYKHGKDWKVTTRAPPVNAAALQRRLYYLAPAADWAAAKAGGAAYAGGQLDRDSGFIHLSTHAQAAAAAALHFKGQSDTQLLTIDAAKLPADALKWELEPQRED
eukprot:COSAG04_NODE_7407_length_1133_cov_1.540619_1_plen_193_part_01